MTEVYKNEVKDLETQIETADTEQTKEIKKLERDLSLKFDVDYRKIRDEFQI